MTSTTGDAEDVEWRRLSTTLVVAIAADRVIGCIEEGRRCVVTDGEGRVFGRCRRLSDAQALLVLLWSRRSIGGAGEVRGPR